MSLDVARAFALFAKISGDGEFLREKAWPVLSGVAEWVTSRVAKSSRGYEIRRSMGIAEREKTAENAVSPTWYSSMVLKDATDAASQLGRCADPLWMEIARAIAMGACAFRSNRTRRLWGREFK